MSDNGFKLGATSLKRLEGVNPDLVKIVKRAIEITTCDFAVIEGLRTVEKQREYVDQGFSKTMRSYHIVGRAVDLYPFYDGKTHVDAKPDKWQEVANAMLHAAAELKLKITWGGSWKSFVDKPHYQLEPYIAGSNQ
jgi:peptidoglycan L-alanyl-D-glutamate endopeptidase CwlK